MAVLRLKEIMALKGMSRDELSTRLMYHQQPYQISQVKKSPTIQLLLRLRL
jgi:transcriptional regulator with XRE-family HTH domain